VVVMRASLRRSPSIRSETPHAKDSSSPFQAIEVRRWKRRQGPRARSRGPHLQLFARTRLEARLRIALLAGRAFRSNRGQRGRDRTEYEHRQECSSEFACAIHAIPPFSAADSGRKSGGDLRRLGPDVSTRARRVQPGGVVELTQQRGSEARSPVGRSPWSWEGDLDLGSASGGGGEVEVCVEGACSLLHADEAEPVVSVGGVRLEAGAVVGDGEPEP
jgi:hypothetical protein